MKKLLLLFAFLMGLFLTGKAQNPITISWDGITYNDTATVFGAPNDEGELTFHAIVHNNTDNGMNVLVVRHNLDVIDGTQNSFCWPTICWSPMVDTSGQAGFIPAGGQSAEEEFSGHYRYSDDSGNPLYGTSLVKYYFYNVDHPEMIDSVVVKYQLGYTGIGENEDNSFISDIYPNPASTWVSFDYQLDNNVASGEVHVVNLVGKVVKTIKLNKNRGHVKTDISDLSEGLYFYTVSLNGKTVKTQKLIIKK